MKSRLVIIMLAVILSLFMVNPIRTLAVNEADIDVKTYETDNSEFVSCGTTKNSNEPLMSDIPKSIPDVVHKIYIIILVAVPVVLVVFGSLDLFKGLSSQKEEEIKKGQQIFIKRLIAAVIVFFVLVIIKLFIDMAADSNSSGIINCVECFIENKCN